jgi:hypothetical protein
LILNPIIEATHQQPQIFAEVRTGDDGAFSVGLPVGKPFVVVLPRNGANNEARIKENEANDGLHSQQQMIGERGGPMGQPAKTLVGEMEVRIEGDKLKVGFRELREVSVNVEGAPRPGAQAPDEAWQQNLRAFALESAAQAIRMGDLYILHEPGITPRERTHDPETGYPILGLPVGDPEAFKLYNEAMRAYFRDQKAAEKADKSPAHIAAITEAVLGGIELKVAQQQLEKVLGDLQAAQTELALLPSRPGQSDAEQKAEATRAERKFKVLEDQAARLRAEIEQRTRKP